MAAPITFSVPTDTSQFTALQLQPRAVLSLAWNGYARWLRENAIPLPRLIGERGFGTVIVGSRLDYLEPLSFFEADELEIRVRLSNWEDRIIVLNAEVSGAGRRVAEISVSLYPVDVQESTSLAAEASSIPPDVAAYLVSHEDDTSGADVPSLDHSEYLRRLGEHGTQLVTIREIRTVLHHHCEVAEQWSFIELPGLVQSVREPLALDQHESWPELRMSLSMPLVSYSAELNRPIYVFDQFFIETIAHSFEGHLVFTHRLTSDMYADGKVATVVERF